MPLPSFFDWSPAIEEAPVEAVLVVGVVKLINNFGNANVGVVVALDQELELDVPVQDDHRAENFLGQRGVRVEDGQEKEIGIYHVLILDEKEKNHDTLWLDNCFQQVNVNLNQ